VQGLRFDELLPGHFVGILKKAEYLFQAIAEQSVGDTLIDDRGHRVLICPHQLKGESGEEFSNFQVKPGLGCIEFSDYQTNEFRRAEGTVFRTCS
jgi:hypothetical protein